MLRFEKVDVTHKEKVEPFLMQDGEFTTERNFACLYIWAGHYNTEVCVTNDFCFIRAKDKGAKNFSYYPPLGKGDIENAIKQIAMCEDMPVINMFGLSQNQVQQYQSLFANRISVQENRDSFDYVYTANSLINLTGKSYSAKRNHINKFKSLYDGVYEYRNIDFEKDTNLIIDFQNKWCVEKDGENSNEYKHENCAIKRILKHHKQLDAKGGILFVNGNVAAFTIASPTNSTVMDVLFEKADTEINGSYPMINNQFAANNCANYTYINREEDMGIEGLRKAKLSYYPEMLVPKYSARIML